MIVPHCRIKEAEAAIVDAIIHSGKGEYIWLSYCQEIFTMEHVVKCA